MTRQIPVYAAERAAGLEQQIRSTARLAYASVIEMATASETDAAKIKKLAEANKAIATNEGQIDLHYMKSILATVGWNKNDDVFDRIETWLARSTSEDKPFNYEHNATDIIGHITGNYIMDFDGNIVKDDSVIDELPDKFHIVNTEVLYKYWPPQHANLVERMKQIIAEISEQKWYVSMEVLFDNFDYAVITPDGKNQVVARDTQSAFLTKHLRAYGGTGVYEGHKIGRLLRNMGFSGKGMVRRPANPYSIIFENVTAFEKPTLSSVGEFKQVGYSLVDRQTSNEERRMAADNVTQVELLQNENKRLEQTLSAAVAAQKEAEKRLTEMNEQTVKAKLDGLAQDVNTRDEKITSLTTQIQTEQKARTEAEAKLKELEGKVTTLQAEITKANAEKNKVSRLAAISSELGKNAADAEKFYATMAELNMSDEQFTKFIATIKSEKTPPSTDTTNNNSPGAALDNAQAKKNPPFGTTDGVNGNVEQTRAGLAKFIGSNYLHGTKVKKPAAE